MAKHTIKISVLAETSKFRRSMKDLGDVSGINKLANGVKNLAGHLVTAAKYAGALGAAFGTYAVKAASDLEQSVGTIDDIFKEHAHTVHQFARNAAIDVGLSANSYNELAAVISTQLKNGGTAMSDLAGKSHELISLGSDLSAGFGGSTADAVKAISSALKGERDPIERYGVALKQATIDAKAAQMGFSKIGGALSNEASQAATLALIMEQTADMHGKFDRETNTLQHNIEVLKAKLENAAASMGTYLLPAITQAVAWLSDHLDPALETIAKFIESHVKPALASLAQKFQEWLPHLQRTGQEIAARLIPAFRNFGQLVADLIPKIVSFGQFLARNKETIATVAVVVLSGAAALKVFNTALAGLKVAKAAFAALNAGMAALAANPIGLVVVAIGMVVAGLVLLYQRSETFRNLITAVWQAVQSAVAAVVEWFSTTVVPVLSNVFSIVKSSAELLWLGISTAFQLISAVVSTAVNAITTVLSPLTGLISGIFSAVHQVVTATWQTAWNIAKNVVSLAWNAISGYVNFIASTVKGAVATVRALLSGDFSGAWNIAKNVVSNAWTSMKSAVTSGINQVVSTVKQLPSKIKSALGNLGSLLFNAGKSVIDGFLGGITSMFGQVKSKLSELTSWLPDWKGPAKTDAKILRKSGQLVIDGFVAGLESSYGHVKNSLSQLTQELPNMVSNRGELTLTGTYSAPSPVYHITVQALSPSPEIGRAVVSALRAYESAGGRR